MTRQQPTASRGDAAKLQRARRRTAGTSRHAVRPRREERVWRERKSSNSALATADALWEDENIEAGDNGISQQASCSTPPSARRGTPCGSLSGPPTAVERPPAAEGRQAAGPAGELSRPVDRPGERAAKAKPLSEPELVERGLAGLLVQMAAKAPAPARRTPFQSKCVPSISIKDYVARVVRFSRCCPACVVASLVYLDRLMKSHPCIVIGPLTCHRLVLTSIVLAIKFNDDKYFSNRFYSKVGGMQLEELNVLERSFLKLVDFKLSVSPQEYDLYRSLLLRPVQIEAGRAPPMPMQAE